jgi:hypothetical protein
MNGWVTWVRFEVWSFVRGLCAGCDWGTSGHVMEYQVRYGEIWLSGEGMFVRCL